MNKLTNEDRSCLADDVIQLRFLCSRATISLEAADTLDADVLRHIEGLGKRYKRIADRIDDIFRRKAATETTP